MNSNGFYDKFPEEIRDFYFDATTILIGGDTIANVQVLSLSSGFSIVSSSFLGTLITFRVSGGIAGQVASAVVKATLTSGQLREGLLQIVIKPLPTS